jgi:hypothetical protein
MGTKQLNDPAQIWVEWAARHLVKTLCAEPACALDAISGGRGREHGRSKERRGSASPKRQR